MPRRSPPPVVAAAALTIVTTLALAGCASDSGSGGGDPLSGVTVTQPDPKKAPTVNVTPTPFEVTETANTVLTDGDGAVVKDTDILTMNAQIINGADGKVVNSTWESDPVSIPLTQQGAIPALSASLPGKKIGSQVLVAAPPAQAFGDQGSAQLGLGAEDSVIFLVDLVSVTTPLTGATGAAVPPKKGLPTVTLTPGEPAVITIPKGAKPPTKLVVQPLVKGTGPAIKAGQTVRVGYTGALWKNGEVFDASAKRPDTPYIEFQAGAGGVIPAWDKGLVGQSVGSRVLLVAPPAEGYGAAGNPDANITGTDTLVFVIDILAAY